MTRREAYRELGVPATATRDEVRAAYVALAKRWHPDKHRSDGGDRAADVVFARITEAYRAIASASFDPEPPPEPPPEARREPAAAPAAEPTVTRMRPESAGARNPPGSGWPPRPPWWPDYYDFDASAHYIRQDDPRYAEFMRDWESGAWMSDRDRPKRHHRRSVLERILDAPQDFVDWCLDRLD